MPGASTPGIIISPSVPQLQLRQHNLRLDIHVREVLDHALLCEVHVVLRRDGHARGREATGAAQVDLNIWQKKAVRKPSFSRKQIRRLSGFRKATRYSFSGANSACLKNIA